MAQEISLTELLYFLKDQKKNDDIIKFFGYCVANMDESHSQNFQDIWAIYENQYKANHGDGFFVEFGATNGIDGSNTYLLEKRCGWKGILAEPNPVWHKELFENRKATIVTDCVYTETGKTVSFVDAPDPCLSTIQGYGENDEHSKIREQGKTVEVNTISLHDLLANAPYVIDYMSIDTEGSEFDILNAYFSKNADLHFIKCITIEHNFDNTLRTQVFDLLTKHGYKRKFVELSRWDDFYIKE